MLGKGRFAAGKEPAPVCISTCCGQIFFCIGGATLAATLHLLRHQRCAKRKTSDNFESAFGFVGCSNFWFR